MLELIRLLVSIPAPFNMITVIGLGFAVSLCLAAVAREIRKFAETRQIIAFKRELVDRGLAVDEIERVANPATTREQSRSQRVTAPYAGMR
jgi:hypothetical protein